MYARIALVAALALAACSGGTGTTTTSAPSSTTTDVTATTTSLEVTTTTAVEDTTTTIATTTTVDTSSLADGSGCAPGTPDDLPDGEWFGYATAAADTTMDFDLACWFSGDAAALAADEDGAESPPPNDYYIRNENPAVRTLDVSPDVEVESMVTWGDPSTYASVDWADWSADRVGPLDGFEDDVFVDIWITVEDGEVVGVEEQYRP